MNERIDTFLVGVCGYSLVAKLRCWLDLHAGLVNYLSTSNLCSQGLSF